MVTAVLTVHQTEHRERGKHLEESLGSIDAGVLAIGPRLTYWVMTSEECRARSGAGAILPGHFITNVFPLECGAMEAQGCAPLTLCAVYNRINLCMSEHGRARCASNRYFV